MPEGLGERCRFLFEARLVGFEPLDAGLLPGEGFVGRRHLGDRLLELGTEDLLLPGGQGAQLPDALGEPGHGVRVLGGGGRYGGFNRRQPFPDGGQLLGTLAGFRQVGEPRGQQFPLSLGIPQALLHLAQRVELSAQPGKLDVGSGQLGLPLRQPCAHRASGAASSSAWGRTESTPANRVNASSSARTRANAVSVGPLCSGDRARRQKAVLFSGICLSAASHKIY